MLRLQYVLEPAYFQFLYSRVSRTQIMFQPYFKLCERLHEQKRQNLCKSLLYWKWGVWKKVFKQEIRWLTKQASVESPRHKSNNLKDPSAAVIGSPKVFIIIFQTTILEFPVTITLSLLCINNQKPKEVDLFQFASSYFNHGHYKCAVTATSL